jgi:hypothetical protein
MAVPAGSGKDFSHCLVPQAKLFFPNKVKCARCVKEVKLLSPGRGGARLITGIKRAYPYLVDDSVS